jgi:hypothetical protein
MPASGIPPQFPLRAGECPVFQRLQYCTMAGDMAIFRPLPWFRGKKANFFSSLPGRLFVSENC